MNTKILSNEMVKLNAKVANKEEAIRLAGNLLVEANHVSSDYVEKMLEREALTTTYIGNGVAIPHGTEDSKKWITSTGLSFVQIPDGVDFGNGNIAFLVIGIAAVGDEHLEVLSNIAIVISEEENVEKIVQSTSKEEILELFSQEM